MASANVVLTPEELELIVQRAIERALKVDGWEDVKGKAEEQTKEESGEEDKESEESSCEDFETLGIRRGKYTAEVPGSEPGIERPSNIRSWATWDKCTINFGTKHKGKTYIAVYNQHPEHQTWILSHAKAPST